MLPHQPHGGVEVREDTDRDFILTAEEAKAYGVVDDVVTDRKLRFARVQEPGAR